MSHIVFIGANNAIVILQEIAQTETIMQRIRMGLWEPPKLELRGPFQATQKGETVVISPVDQRETLGKRLIFTPTEARIIQGLASGLTDEQIALSVRIKPRTVRFYVTRLKERLGAATREHLVAKAGMLGLYDGSSIGLDN